MDNQRLSHGTTVRLAGEDAPVSYPSARDRIATFRNAAVAAGLIRPGDPIDGHLVDFAYRIVELCARLAGSDADVNDTGAGAIRAHLGEHPQRENRTNALPEHRNG